MYLAYSLLMLVVFVLLLPYFLYQAIRYKKYIGTLGQRLIAYDVRQVRSLPKIHREIRLSMVLSNFVYGVDVRVL